MIKSNQKHPSNSYDNLPAAEMPATEETLLKEILTEAKKKDKLDGKPLQERIEHVLDLRIKNEVRILNLIDECLIYVNDEGEDVVADQALALHKSHKDSLSELVKVFRLLSDLSTENVNVSVEEKEELARLRGEIYGRG